MKEEFQSFSVPKFQSCNVPMFWSSGVLRQEYVISSYLCNTPKSPKGDFDGCIVLKPLQGIGVKKTRFMAEYNIIIVLS